MCDFDPFPTKLQSSTILSYIENENKAIFFEPNLIRRYKNPKESNSRTIYNRNAKFLGFAIEVAISLM